MTTFNLTCEAVEATLPDYLDETLEPWVRISIEEHLGGCVRCAGLARELRNLTREASALPALVPEREIWPGVAGRIGAPANVAEPVAESEPLPPKIEPVLSSDAFLPIGEPPVLASERPLLADGPPLLADQPALLADGPPRLADELPLFADGPPLLPDAFSLPTSEPPPLAHVLPLLADRPPLLADELSLPISEPPPLADVLSRPTPEPLAPPIEPLSSGPVPVPVTAPAFALPYRREKRWGSREMGLAAAALVLVTAGTASFLTVQWLARARTPSVASGTSGGRGSATNKSAEAGTRTPSLTREQLASGASTPTPLPGQLGSALTVSATSAPQVARSPEEVVYDKEIKTLQGIVRRQKPELDASTVTVIDKNLRTLDSAIAQIRAALQKDPGSPLLDAQATRALEMKVELLRRTAMLRSSTI